MPGTLVVVSLIDLDEVFGIRTAPTSVSQSP